MNRWLRLGGIVFIVLAVLQVVGPTRPEVHTDNPDDFLLKETSSPEMSGLLRSACYDCHSLETSFPWYGYVAPFSWILFQHVREGREELNFSTWSSMDKRSKLRALKDIREVLEEKEMPLKPYSIMHPEAQLSADQRKELQNWMEDLAKRVLVE